MYSAKVIQNTPRVISNTLGVFFVTPKVFSVIL